MNRGFLFTCKVKNTTQCNNLPKQTRQSSGKDFHSALMQASCQATNQWLSFRMAVQLISGKSRSKEELFSKFFVNVNVIQSLKKEMYIPFESIPKEDNFCP